MSKKLSYHVQQIPEWAKRNNGEKMPDWPSIINPPSTNPWPGRRATGRTYMDDGPSNDLVAFGTQGAIAWVKHFMDAYKQSPWVYAWRGPNEPPCQTVAERAAINAFVVKYVELMHDMGLLTAGPDFSTFQPPHGVAREMKEAILALDIITFHEYDQPTMMTHEGEGCLRYRKFWAELSAVGIAPKPTIVTETGLDDGLKHGWKTFAHGDIPTFVDQLMWYNGEICKDDYLLAADVFTAGPIGWDDFEMTEPLVDAISQASAVGTTAVPPPVVPSAPSSAAPTNDEMRQALYMAVGQHSTWAFPEYARLHKLGGRVGPEFRAGGWVWQGYATCIIKAPEGRWDKIVEIPW